MKIWTDDEELEVEPNNVGELEAAMRFKAENIHAKADPELFKNVADTLKDLWDKQGYGRGYQDGCDETIDYLRNLDCGDCGLDYNNCGQPCRHFADMMEGK